MTCASPTASEQPRYRRPPFWLEIFVLANLGFLAPDIYLAHSMNLFRHWAEYIPFTFSLLAPVPLLVGLLGSRRLWAMLGHAVGATSILIGVAGVVWHLDSQFFHQATLASLVYTAPFAAPLAYTGLGLLLVMNRMVDAGSAEWAYWVLLLALGGFVGNFIFSVADHAQNGFFFPSEWAPVVTSALAIGILLVPFMTAVDRRYIFVCGAVMLLQVAIGVLGFFYHTAANVEAYHAGLQQYPESASLLDSFVFGAPTMAPLLLPNMVLLTAIGLWALHGHLPAALQTRRNPDG